MTKTVRPEVATFVTLVRAHLSDLAPEEVDELTGDLEVDLDERLAETRPGDPPADLGDAAAYAAELRAAAGLPPRGAGGGRRAAGPVTRAGRWFRVAVGEARESVAQALDRQPWWPEFRASVAALRPAWWIVRAYVAWSVLAEVFGQRPGLVPNGLGGLIILLVFAGVSVALGRGLLDRPLRLAAGRWPRRIVLSLNVFAVLMLPAVLSWNDTGTYGDSGGGGSDAVIQGLALDGQPVDNIFAYDAQGRPIALVQLYDQDGRPLDVAHQSYVNEFGQDIYNTVNGTLFAPFVDDRSQSRWNVFPLPTASPSEPTYGDDGTLRTAASVVAGRPPAPLVAVPPVTSVLGVPDGARLATGGATPSTAPSTTSTTTPATTPPKTPPKTP